MRGGDKRKGSKTKCNANEGRRAGDGRSSKSSPSGFISEVELVPNGHGGKLLNTGWSKYIEFGLLGGTSSNTVFNVPRITEWTGMERKAVSQSKILKTKGKRTQREGMERAELMA